jgi:hypothetical protein
VELKFHMLTCRHDTTVGHRKHFHVSYLWRLSYISRYFIYLLVCLLSLDYLATLPVNSDKTQAYITWNYRTINEEERM